MLTTLRLPRAPLKRAALPRLAASPPARAPGPRMAASAAGAAAPSAASFRVLAFEDTYAMARILGDAGVAYAQLEQKWTTKCAPTRKDAANLLAVTETAAQGRGRCDQGLRARRAAS